MVLEVIVDISTAEVDRPFDYEGEDMPLGSRVAVDFAGRHTVGFVIGKKEKSDFASLKTARFLDTPVSAEQLLLMNAMREKYNLRHIDVLRLFVPAKLREERDPEYKRIYLALADELDVEDVCAALARAAKQREIVRYLSERDGEFLSVLAEKFGAGAVKGVRDKGFVTESAVHEARTPLKMLTRERKAVTLTSDQQSAVDEISAGKGVFLLHGVTGSGKTEVYMAVIERMLSAGKTAIMLVPEIALTPQILGLFRARFGDSVALMHSGLNAGERYDEWKRMKDGRAKIAVGPRSAVFAPLENIGVIIIDEEHDSSYVSESNPRYDTKEVAKMRAAAAGAALVLGSATPDMESYLNATEGKYKLITLKSAFPLISFPKWKSWIWCRNSATATARCFPHSLPTR